MQSPSDGKRSLTKDIPDKAIIARTGLPSLTTRQSPIESRAARKTARSFLVFSNRTAYEAVGELFIND